MIKNTMRCTRQFKTVLCGLIVIFFFLAGCKTAVGPDFQSPSPRLPETWQITETADNMSSFEPTALYDEWWRVFDDPNLTQLVAEVKKQNRDLVAATARLDSYAAAYGMARAGLMPMIHAQGGISHDRVSERVRNNTNQSFAGNPTWMYEAGFVMSWEIDVWHKIRRNMEAARGEWDASIEDRRNLMVLLQAQAAAEYIMLRTAQQRYAFAQKNVTLQEETLQLVQDRFDAGLTGELDVHQAKMNLASTRARLPALKTQQTEALNALSLLTGRLPGELNKLLTPKCIPMASALPLLLPAELVRNRPDIRAAERLLAAQTARIGVANADFYPALTLDGMFSLASSDSGEFLSSAAQKHSIGPSFTWSLYNGGLLRSRVQMEEAATRATLALYEQTVLAAFRECEDALAAYINEGATLNALNQAVASTQKSVELSQSLYITGLVNFQNVLDMQRQLASFQDQLAQSMGQSSVGLVAVYKAFGGGWQPE
ncbi:MAG: efflux transporter outer membrane subunit [Desulfotignum sp.]|nr:efflux transporter outer membrane subunit [Desulfotignum sp.]